MELRLRLSLVARMAVAAAVLSSLSFVLAIIVGVLGALFGLTIPGAVTWPLETARTAPRLSAAFSIPAPLVALAALIVSWAIFRYWSRVAHLTSNAYLLPPSDPIQWAVAVVTLGCLYEVFVETGAVLHLALSGLLGSLWTVLGSMVVGVVLSLAAVVLALRAEVRSLQNRSIDGSAPAGRDFGRLVEIVGRLAHQAVVPAPEVRVTSREHPMAFTVGSRANATLVVSTGLLDLLPTPELEAVLAHEVSHLANGDSRLMAAALAPVVYAESLITEDPTGVGDWVWWLVGHCLLRYGQFGVAVLSQGREWAADAGAASLTGSPAALASALARLDDRREVPRADLREWAGALAALDVLPTLSPDERQWPFRTHPSTEERIARLRRLAARQERR